MDIITLFLQNRREQETLLDVTNKFKLVILGCQSPTIFQLIERPFPLYRFTTIQPTVIKPLSGRTYLVDNLFVYKYDEQRKANSLSFITNLFARACKVNSPDMILSKPLYTIEGERYEGEKLVQIIQYIPDWIDYSSAHPRSKGFVKQLASLLAFDLVIGNSDRFLFITKFIDNILFRDDPDYQEMDIWDSPQINEGNFGFVGSDLWSLDHRANDDLNFIIRLHQLATDDFLQSCSMLMAEYFQLNQREQVVLRDKLSKYLRHYLTLFPLFTQLHNWVNSYK